MRRAPYRRVIAATGVIGTIAVLWLLPIGSGTDDDSPDTAATQPQTDGLLDLREEVGLLDYPGAALEVTGAVEGHFVLPWLDGGVSPNSYFSKRDEVGYQPPLVFRVKYAGEGSEFTAVSYGDLQVSRPETSGFTVVATLSGKTYANTATAFCELEVLEASFTILDADWLSDGTLLYQPDGATIRLSCVNMAELRTGDLISLDVAFRLPPNPILVP